MDWIDKNDEENLLALSFDNYKLWTAAAAAGQPENLPKHGRGVQKCLKALSTVQQHLKEQQDYRLRLGGWKSVEKSTSEVVGAFASTLPLPLPPPLRLLSELLLAKFTRGSYVM